mmetsp:Transcript_43337/g.122514  ORF Transcript_43337/g.122514 Transcript_43337/m.122514 type:complete len:347 (-) Transcript_43337:48-1088(-)
MVSRPPEIVCAGAVRVVSPLARCARYSMKQKKEKGFTPSRKGADLCRSQTKGLSRTTIHTLVDARSVASNSSVDSKRCSTSGTVAASGPQAMRRAPSRTRPGAGRGADLKSPTMSSKTWPRRPRKPSGHQRSGTTRRSMAANSSWTSFRTLCAASRPVAAPAATPSKYRISAAQRAPLLVPTILRFVVSKFSHTYCTMPSWWKMKPHTPGITSTTSSSEPSSISYGSMLSSHRAHSEMVSTKATQRSAGNAAARRARPSMVPSTVICRGQGSAAESTPAPAGSACKRRSSPSVPLLGRCRARNCCFSFVGEFSASEAAQPNAETDASTSRVWVIAATRSLVPQAGA